MFSKLTDSFRQQGTTLWCIAALVVVAAAVAAPWMNPYYTRVMTMGLMCGYLAASWNLIGGYAGQMSLGHALFFAIGSYSVALLARMPDVPLVAAFPLAILVSVGLAWIIATICFRYALRGIYFAVGTLLLAEIARILVINSDVLGRSQGLQIPGMQGALNFSFGSDLPFFYIFLGISIALALGSLALERCKLGYDLVALREQEEGAQALGVDVAAIKRLAFVLSAALTCVGGVIYAGLVRYVEPGYDLSLSITLFMVMGAVLEDGHRPGAVPGRRRDGHRPGDADHGRQRVRHDLRVGAGANDLRPVLRRDPAGVPARHRRPAAASARRPQGHAPSRQRNPGGVLTC